MAYSQLSRYITWTHAVVGQLDDALAHDVGQRTTVHEYATQLIHSAVACKMEGKI